MEHAAPGIMSPTWRCGSSLQACRAPRAVYGKPAPPRGADPVTAAAVFHQKSGSTTKALSGPCRRSVAEPRSGQRPQLRDRAGRSQRPALRHVCPARIPEGHGYFREHHRSGASPASDSGRQLACRDRLRFHRRPRRLGLGDVAGRRRRIREAIPGAVG